MKKLSLNELFHQLEVNDLLTSSSIKGGTDPITLDEVTIYANQNGYYGGSPYDYLNWYMTLGGGYYGYGGYGGYGGYEDPNNNGGGGGGYGGPTTYFYDGHDPVGMDKDGNYFFPIQNSQGQGLPIDDGSVEQTYSKTCLFKSMEVIQGFYGMSVVSELDLATNYSDIKIAGHYTKDGVQYSIGQNTSYSFNQVVNSAGVDGADFGIVLGLTFNISDVTGDQYQLATNASNNQASIGVLDLGDVSHAIVIVSCDVFTGNVECFNPGTGNYERRNISEFEKIVTLTPKTLP